MQDCGRHGLNQEIFNDEERGKRAREEVCGFASRDVNKQLAKAGLFDTCDIALFGVWQVYFLRKC